MQIKKRDGRLVLFDKEKIVNAVLNAFNAVDGSITDYAIEKATNIADYIFKECESFDIVDIEHIQDLVEHGLMSCKRKDVARAYISYRNERTQIREQKNRILAAAKRKLNGKDIVNQNANVDEHSFGGRKGEADSVINKQLALDEYMSKMSRDNHLNNEIYIHDLDSYVVGSHNCLSVPIDDLLANGFKARQTDVRPAGNLTTAFQLLAVIFQIQSLEQFGGVSATHLDWSMVPYVRKSFAKWYRDGLEWICEKKPEEIDYEIEFMLNNPTEYSITDSEYSIYEPRAFVYAHSKLQKEAHQAVESMFHNLNTLQSRSGN